MINGIEFTGYEEEEYSQLRRQRGISQAERKSRNVRLEGSF